MVDMNRVPDPQHICEVSPEEMESIVGGKTSSPPSRPVWRPLAIGRIGGVERGGGGDSNGYHEYMRRGQMDFSVGDFFKDRFIQIMFN